MKNQPERKKVTQELYDQKEDLIMAANIQNPGENFK